jgi:hypothetical protein
MTSDSQLGAPKVELFILKAAALAAVITSLVQHGLMLAVFRGFLDIYKSSIGKGAALPWITVYLIEYQVMLITLSVVIALSALVCLWATRRLQPTACLIIAVSNGWALLLTTIYWVGVALPWIPINH